MIATIFVLAVVYALLYVQIFLHEREHAKEMIKYGLQPQQVFVGLPIPFLNFLQLKFSHKKILNGTPIIIYPLLLAGAAKLSSDQFSDLSKRDFATQASIYSAGVWANLFYSVLGFILYRIFMGRMDLTLVYLTLAAAGLYFGKRLLCVYLFPIVSLALGPYLLPSIFESIFMKKPNPEATFTHDVVGIVSTGLSLEQASTIVLGGGAVLALVNLLPLFPADGGRLVYALFSLKSKTIAVVFSALSFLFLAVIMFYSALIELYAIFTKL